MGTSSVSRYVDERPEIVDLVPRETKRVLDVGCSTGNFGRTLLASRPDIEIIGVEPNKEAAEMAQAAYSDVRVGNFPEVIAEPSANERFDLITFNDVLEHMVEPGLALRACEGLLNRGGLVIASIPNVRHVSVVLPLMIRGEWRYKPTGILDATHLRFFTKKSIRRLFEEQRFEILDMAPINIAFRPGPSRTNMIIKRISKLGRGHFDGFLAVQWVVTAHLPSIN